MPAAASVAGLATLAWTGPGGGGDQVEGLLGTERTSGGKMPDLPIGILPVSQHEQPAQLGCGGWFLHRRQRLMSFGGCGPQNGWRPRTGRHRTSRLGLA